MSRKRLTAIAVGAGLAVVSLGGLALNLPGVASAQDSTDTTVQETPKDGPHGHDGGHGQHGQRGDHGPGGRGGHMGRGPGGGPGLEAAATAIGITAEELRTQLQAGQSISAVAEANGVDVDTVIDAMTNEARTRITEMVNRVPSERMGRGDGMQGDAGN
jgi:hypothetical protein